MDPHLTKTMGKVQTYISTDMTIGTRSIMDFMQMAPDIPNLEDVIFSLLQKFIVLLLKFYFPFGYLIW